MAKSRRRAKILETKFFGLIIGAVVVLIFFAIGNYTSLLRSLELRITDLQFTLKNQVSKTNVQVGVSVVQRNPKISPDILIVGLDPTSLEKFGRFPWPRYREADFLNGFTRIKDQSQRERAIFLDIFFVEPDSNAYDDALLVDAIKNNGRVFLETVLDDHPTLTNTSPEYIAREDALAAKDGEITHVSGDWQEMRPFLGVEPPLIPYGEAAAGYGHANYIQDRDAVYRRQILVAKYAQSIREIPLSQLTPQTTIDVKNFHRLAWVDRKGDFHNIPYPLTAAAIGELTAEMRASAPLKVVKTDQSGKVIEGYYVVREFQDHFVPSITLALALDYFHKSLSDVEVHLGTYLLIKSPEMFDTQTHSWVPYRKLTAPAEYDTSGKLVKEAVTEPVSEIRIPIDAQGAMLINFMGPPSSASPAGYQTFPVRSFYGYAAGRIAGPDPKTWPPTRAVANKLILVGAFAPGLSDEKPTPYGLMNGVEIHANALNTIITDDFLLHLSGWEEDVILALLVLLVAFMVSRLSTIWALALTLILLVAGFAVVTVEFELSSLVVNYATPAIAILFTFLTIVVYRVMTDERDKQRIRDMFGKYVNPSVVDQILENPPELGGVDKELTVFFSDIRGFTSLSESMTPQELVNHLNVYLSAMTDIILEYQGTLDKYEGDAIMCFWGAPLPLADHALLACACALKQLAALKRLNEGWPPERRLNIGIGINSGIMTVGNMGSLGRMNYTIMGDAVNLGARLEGTNKQYSTNIIMSEFTYGLVKDKVVARELDNIRVKGKNKPVLIYELIDCLEDPSTALPIGGNRRRAG